MARPLGPGLGQGRGPVTATSNVTSGAPTGTSASTAPCRVTIRPANGEGISTGGLRGLHLDERLVQRDLRALGDEPRDDLAVLETLAEVRHREDTLGHQYFTVSSAAATMRSTLGR